MLPLFAFSAGIYLGLHFNIWVVLPFSLLGAVATMLTSWAWGHSFFDSAGIVLFPIFAVQAGYMIGLTARETYGQLRVRLNIGQSERI
jgi:uncharacterized membrane protein (GlpM family)